MHGCEVNNTKETKGQEKAVRNVKEGNLICQTVSVTSDAQEFKRQMTATETWKKNKTKNKI